MSSNHQVESGSSKGLIVLGTAKELKDRFLSQFRQEDPQILNLGMVGKVIGFVKKWDPDEHPRGYRGRFIDTPDEEKITPVKAKAGDVIVTHRGGVALIADDDTSNFYRIDPDSGKVDTELKKMHPDLKVAVIGNVNDNPEVPPIPEHTIQEAERAGVNAFMREHVSIDWSGGDKDYEYLLNKDDQEVRQGWLENYMTSPPPSKYFTLKSGDEWWEMRMAELDSEIKSAVTDAETRWARNYKRHGVNVDEHTVEVLSAKELASVLEDADEEQIQGLDPSLDQRWDGRESITRQVVADLAMRRINKESLQHPHFSEEFEAEFGLIHLKDVVFEKQDLDEIEESLKDTKDEFIDRPIFFQSGKLKDGILQVGVDFENAGYAHGFVDPRFDKEMREILEGEGATETPNSVDLTEVFAYGGSGDLYRGDSLTIVDQEPTLRENNAVRSQALRDRIRDNLATKDRQIEGPLDKERDRILEMWADADKRHLRESRAEDLEIGFFKIREAAIETLKEEGIFWEDQLDQEISNWIQHWLVGGKAIEYVPHDQKGDHAPDSNGLTTGAATSQRGQLRLHGYTPQEAVDRLKELGIVGDLEPEVPYNAIMGGPRKFGRVAPLHSEYVRGETPVPRVDALVTHGITGGMPDLMKILDTGALLPISERTRLGITTASSTSEKGDVRSGLDGGVFAKIGWSSWGDSGLHIAFKPSVYARRDVLISDTDFGGSPTRYNDYLSYKNRIRAGAGLDEPVSLFEPLEPKARDYHIDAIDPQTSAVDSNEWNLINGVPVEDWAFVRVNHIGEKIEVEKKFDILQKRGLLESRPKVVVKKSDAQAVVSRQKKLEEIVIREPASDDTTKAVRESFKEVHVEEDKDGNAYWVDASLFENRISYKLSQKDGKFTVFGHPEYMEFDSDIVLEAHPAVFSTQEFNTPTEAINAAGRKEVRPVNTVQNVGMDPHTGRVLSAREAITSQFPVKIEEKLVEDDPDDPDSIKWVEQSWQFQHEGTIHVMVFREHPIAEEYEVANITTGEEWLDRDGVKALEKAQPRYDIKQQTANVPIKVTSIPTSFPKPPNQLLPSQATLAEKSKEIEPLVTQIFNDVKIIQTGKGETNWLWWISDNKGYGLTWEESETGVTHWTVMTEGQKYKSPSLESAILHAKGQYKVYDQLDETQVAAIISDETGGIEPFFVPESNTSLIDHWDFEWNGVEIKLWYNTDVVSDRWEATIWGGEKQFKALTIDNLLSLIKDHVNSYD